MNGTNEFKVGDRVIFLQSGHSWHSRAGRIVWDDRSDFMNLRVRFDGPAGAVDELLWVDPSLIAHAPPASAFEPHFVVVDPHADTHVIHAGHDYAAALLNAQDYAEGGSLCHVMRIDCTVSPSAKFAFAD